MENVIIIFFIFLFFLICFLSDPPNMPLHNYMDLFFLMSHYLPGAEVLGVKQILGLLQDMIC